ncbi:Cysteine--tRNA ligase CPS1, chloroplastic/mitochondrial, partial [Sesamum angolense]
LCKIVKMQYPLKEESATNAKVRVSPAAQECISKLHNEFEVKLADDLHTPTILNAALQEALRFINSSLNTLKKKQQKLQQLSTVKSLVDLEKQVREVLDVLGLLPSLSYAEYIPIYLFHICTCNTFNEFNVVICVIGHSVVQVLQQLKDKALKRAGLTEAEILRAIEERMQARKNKEFSRSDQIRSDLAAKGIALMDVGKETVWRPCVPVQQEQPSTPAQQENPGVPGEQQNPPPTEEPQFVIPADKQQSITS